jgi:3-hydroxyacyl-CoA dehydrogenase
MGGGIAMVLANAGIPVLLKETDQAALDRGMATIQSNYANSVKRGRFSPQVAEDRLKRITPTLTYDDFSKVDLVIEAVFEGMALKKASSRNWIACANLAPSLRATPLP